ncbi:MAG: MarR family transcriptional regulator [Alphaproteobacteria bacterium]|nr:MarR family transcriptional regulator [Alphaproteobacteria bacterium]
MPRENLERNFGFILNDVARLLRKVYDRRVRSLGLTRSQWWVVTHLYRSEGVTQSELADILELERASLGRLLDRLEAKGWVRREADAKDRRAKRVYLTAQVEEPMRTMRSIAAGVRGDALSGLSPAQQDRFVDTLLRIKGNLTGLEDGGGGNAGNRRPRAAPR